MKIFSNFDTELDELLVAQQQEKFGEDKVLFVRRDKIYLVLKVYIPITIWFIGSVILLSIRYIAFPGDSLASMLLGYIAWLIVLVWIGWFAISAGKKMIDYYMDYTIITPEQVTQYDQEGIFDRGTRALDISKIKSVSIRKKGLLCSIFNYGSIIFFSEGDASHGDIRLNYISDPIQLRDTIAHILKIHGEDKATK